VPQVRARLGRRRRRGLGGNPDTAPRRFTPAAASGRLLVSDPKTNAISGALDPKTPLVATPDDSRVNGFVGKLNTGTGNITPIIVGFTSPHGMAYLPT